jgi:hypothetical protein
MGRSFNFVSFADSFSILIEIESNVEILAVTNVIFEIEIRGYPDHALAVAFLTKGLESTLLQKLAV